MITTEEIQNLTKEATAFLAAIPELTPYAAPISLGLAVAAAVAPPIYDEIKSLFAKSAAGEEITAEQIASLHALIAALKNPDDYFAAGLASATPPAPSSLNFVR